MPSWLSGLALIVGILCFIVAIAVLDAELPMPEHTDQM